jgi:Ca2+-binding EF-hand superfamily protein
VSVENAFREWDADGGGTLSLGELEDGLRKVNLLPGLSRDDVHKFCAKLDADGSGEIGRLGALLLMTVTRSGYDTHS